MNECYAVLLTAIICVVNGRWKCDDSLIKLASFAAVVHCQSASTMV